MEEETEAQSEVVAYKAVSDLKLKKKIVMTSKWRENDQIMIEKWVFFVKRKSVDRCAQFPRTLTRVSIISQAIILSNDYACMPCLLSAQADDCMCTFTWMVIVSSRKRWWLHAVHSCKSVRYVRRKGTNPRAHTFNFAEIVYQEPPDYFFFSTINPKLLD